jgi:transcriptional regulator with XRE-family HTH domain
MTKDETQNAFNKSIGDNIKRIMKDRGLKQVELARKLEMKANILQLWLGGVNAISLFRLLEISKILGVELAVLVGEKKDNIKTHSYITSHNWDKAHRLFEILRETDNLSHITSEQWNGDALSHLIWENHIETLLEECKGMGMNELNVELFNLLKELERILEEEKAEFLLIDHQ